MDTITGNFNIIQKAILFIRLFTLKALRKQGLENLVVNLSECSLMFKSTLAHSVEHKLIDYHLGSSSPAFNQNINHSVYVK